MIKIVQELIKFCKSHRCIYLYGAGLHAEICYDLLKQQNIIIDGFITTKKEKNIFMNLPVYSVDEIKTLIYSSDGIIPAFYDAEIQVLEQYFVFEKPDFYPLDQKFIIKISSYYTAKKLCTVINNEYGVPDVWNSNIILKEILIVRTDMMGDFICTIPFIRELKKNYPYANISLIIRESNLDLAQNCPYVKRIALYKENVREGGLYEQSKDIVNLKKHIAFFLEHEFTGIRFDAVFLPRELFSGRNMIDDFLFACCSKAKYRIAHIIKNEWEKELLYKVVKNSFSFLQMKDVPMHESEYQLDMLKACGLKVTNQAFELWLCEDNLKNAQNIFLKKGIGENSILCAVGIVGSEERKNWKIENYQKLFSIFRKKYGVKYKFLLFGGNDAVNAARNLVIYENTVDLTGQLQLGDTIALMKMCHMYVGSNTGLLHIASAFGKPAVVLNFSLDDEEEIFSAGPVRWGAYGVEKCELVPPSGLDGCHGVCSKKYSHCINQITVEEVAASIEKLSKYK